MDTSDRESALSEDTKSSPFPDVGDTPGGKGVITTRKDSFVAWVQTVWGLIVHTLVSLGIVAFFICYVENRPFNVHSRHATVDTIEGAFELSYNLLQSDVVTILSSMIVVQKWALTAWVAPLCWRAAVFLMERDGLRREDFKTLVKYKLLTPRTYLTNLATFLIGTLLLASLGSNFSSPLLTGSVTWTPMNDLVTNLTLDPVQFSDAEATLLANPEYAEYYRQSPFDASVGFSVGYVNTAWGRDTEKGFYKQISPSVGALAINSTVEKVTLPYLEVHSIEWIEKASDIPNFPTQETNGILGTILQPLYDSIPSKTSWLPHGFALLVPNTVTKWSNIPANSTIINERRLLVLSCASDEETDPPSIGNVTTNLPDSAYRLHEDSLYYAFAWVTFSAGVGRCDQCNVSSPFTVRNDTTMKLEPHPLTSMALAMAPSVSVSLVAEGSSIPSSLDNTGTDADDYVEAILVRSYAGAWINANTQLATVKANSNYVPSMPVVVARVDRARAYGWLGVQLFVTLLGAGFVVLQYCSKYPLIGGTALTPFYLNTLGVPRTDTGDPFKKGSLKIQQDNDRLVIV